MKLSPARFRNLLRENHIIFDEKEVFDPKSPRKTPLPNQVKHALDRFLRLDQIVPGTWVDDGDHYAAQHWDEFHASHSPAEYPDLYFYSAKLANRRTSHLNQEELQLKDRKLRNNFKIAMSLVDEAVRLDGWREISEGRYHEVLNTYLFRDWMVMATTNPHGHDMQNDSISCFEDSQTFINFFKAQTSKPTIAAKAATVQDADDVFFDSGTNDNTQSQTNTSASTQEPRKKLKKPKPDWAFAFPIYQEPGMHADGPHIHTEASIFSLVNLAYLEDLGIVASPTIELIPHLMKRGSAMLGKHNLRDVDKSLNGDKPPDERVLNNLCPDARLQCYPWAIVELKRPGAKDDQIIYAYSQAANTCSACLTMLERLADNAKDPIPPVAALTFIGPSVKVWLSYAEEDPDLKLSRKKMICIWEGSLMEPLDAVILVRIKELILEWAWGYFKPWVRSRLQNRYRDVFQEESAHKEHPGHRKLSHLAFGNRTALAEEKHPFWSKSGKLQEITKEELVGEWHPKQPLPFTPPHIRQEPPIWNSIPQESSPTPLSKRPPGRNRRFQTSAVKRAVIMPTTALLHGKEKDSQSKVLTKFLRGLKLSNKTKASNTDNAGLRKSGREPLGTQVPSDIQNESSCNDERHVKEGRRSTAYKKSSTAGRSTIYDKDCLDVESQGSEKPNEPLLNDHFRDQLKPISSSSVQDSQKLAFTFGSSQKHSNFYSFSQTVNSGTLLESVADQVAEPSEKDGEVNSFHDNEEITDDEISYEIESESSCSDESTTLGCTPVLFKDSPLYRAIERGDVRSVIEYLSAYKSHVNGQDKDLQTPLHTAVFNHQTKMVKLLIKRGASMDRKCKEGITPFHLAVIRGNFESAKILLQEGADVNRRAGYKNNSGTEGEDDDAVLDGWTCLDYAVRCGRFEWVRFLLQKGARINRKNRDGSTPFHSAIDTENLKMARLLVENGAKVHVKDKRGWSPILEASESGNLRILHYLAGFSEVKMDIEARDHELRTTVHAAAEHDNLDVLKLLVEKGASIDPRDYKGYTPLHFAAHRGRSKCVKYLVEKKAVLNGVTADKWTPLLLAAMSDDLDTFRILYSVARDDKHKTDGWTPLHVAAMKGCEDIVSFLLGQEADANAVTNEGYTPLHLAAENGHKEVITSLDRTGATLNAKSSKGETPLTLAIENGRTSVADLLRLLHEERFSMFGRRSWK